MYEKSDHFNGKIFSNPVPTDIMDPGAFIRVLKEYTKKHPGRAPIKPIGPFHADLQMIRDPAADKLRITWLGHSTVLIEIDGKRFLTDPVWYNRASPFLYLGPTRFFANPISKEDLPHIDYILLSHDHYDHLDRRSLLYLAIEKQIPVITMLGVGKRLINWGVREDLVTELDWWNEIKLAGGFIVTAAPARHFSGRSLRDRFTTLWGSFAIRGPKHNLYYGADSGYYDGFKTIGNKLGPFDLSMLEIGAYYKEWASIHMGPEGAVQAQTDLNSKLLLPLHWGTFSLSFHPWKEPVERLLIEAKRKDVHLLLPAPGETIDVSNGEYNSRWWERYE